MPDEITPMQAHLAERPPSGDSWLYEIKWDGVRVLCFIRDGQLHMSSRRGNSYDRQYPELTVLPHYINAETAILDGEIAALDAQGRSRFQLLQHRIHQTDPNTISHNARKDPVKFFAFDLLYLNGYDLRGAPLVQRKQALQSILRECPRMQFSEHYAAQGREMLEAARANGLEGVIAKRAGSTYESKRSHDWVKLKVVLRQEFVICGYTLGERDTFSSLVLGLREKGAWIYAGNVGTGFNDALLQKLFKMLQELETTQRPFASLPAILKAAKWVRPELVCEVKFAEWSQDQRLRAPVFLGLRNDKRPEDCIRETPSDEPVAASEKVPNQHDAVPTGKTEALISLDGQTIKLTNLNKVYFPKDRCTKGDVLHYYDQVADLLLPYLKDRPLSLKRYPNGIQEPFFFQKSGENLPDWIRTEPVFSEHRQAPIHFPVADNKATLLYLANLGCIDQNPWMSRIGSLEYPDFILVDLDPQECSYDMIVEAAQLVRDKLEVAGLKGYPKTTGGDGMHIYVPIEPQYTYEQARSFAEVLAQLVVSEARTLFTTPRSVVKRQKGRVYFDYLQIGTGKTIAAPYVLRAYDGAPVAAPLDWSEVKKGLQPKQFNISNAVDRFRRLGDLFRPVLDAPQRLEPAIARLKKAMGS